MSLQSEPADARMREKFCALRDKRLAERPFRETL